MTTKNQVQGPSVTIMGPDGTTADVDSGGHLLTGGAVGIAFLLQGAKTMIVGPSGFVANVDSNGNLQTTNG